MKQFIERKHPTIAVCGLDCGLCPRYYTSGPSRCPGCGGPDFFNKHPSCSLITCCVNKKGLEVCAECLEFPCSRFKSEEEYQQLQGSPSYPPYSKVMANLYFIKEHGIGEFALQQKKRMDLLTRMIQDFDDGRSKSFFCRVACLMEIMDLENAVNEADKKTRSGDFTPEDAKARNKALKQILNEKEPSTGQVKP
jgi:Protein of unknown function (DUF3795)